MIEQASKTVGLIAQIVGLAGFVLYSLFMLHLLFPAVYHRLLDWLSVQWERLLNLLDPPGSQWDKLLRDIP